MSHYQSPLLIQMHLIQQRNIELKERVANLESKYSKMEDFLKSKFTDYV